MNNQLEQEFYTHLYEMLFPTSVFSDRIGVEYDRVRKEFCPEAIIKATVNYKIYNDKVKLLPVGMSAASMLTANNIKKGLALRSEYFLTNKEGNWGDVNFEKDRKAELEKRLFLEAMESFPVDKLTELLHSWTC